MVFYLENLRLYNDIAGVQYEMITETHSLIQYMIINTQRCLRY